MIIDLNSSTDDVIAVDTSSLEVTFELIDQGVKALGNLSWYLAIYLNLSRFH